MKTFPLILVIWLGCAFAWMLLGTSLVARTGASSSALQREVHLLWGPPLSQSRPTAAYHVPETVMRSVQRAGPNGVTVTAQEPERVMRQVPVPLRASALQVALDLTHRRKGLLWFPTYGVDFGGTFAFENPTDQAREVNLTFPLVGEGTVYDGFRVTDSAGKEVASTIASCAASWRAHFEPGERRAFEIRYRSRGTSQWSYKLTDGTGEVHDFTMDLATNFPNVDFPAGSISPSRSAVQGGRWSGHWQFERLVADAPIGIALPERLNPGPLASRITFFAPVGLLFFFFVVAILSTARAQRIHPMNYFFFGCGFFAFHLLFAYLVDHLPIAASFAFASLVSLLLVVSYARLFTGWQFAMRTVGVAQFLYLVLFSVTFFWEGYTGLAITVGAVLTLFVMMQVTGRTDWDRAGTAAMPAPGRA